MQFWGRLNRHTKNTVGVKRMEEINDSICNALFEDVDGVWKYCILPKHSSPGHVGAGEITYSFQEDYWTEDFSIYSDNQEYDWED